MERRRLNGVSAAIFDLDGTLFDSVGLWHEIDEIFLSKRGKVPTNEYKTKIAALGFTATAHFTVEYYGLEDTPEQLMAEWDELARDAYSHTIKLFDGVREYLEECRAAGIAIAAVTSLHIELARAGLENNGIMGYFEKVFTTDELKLPKSSPEIYRRAARELGVDARACVVFDDVAEALSAAKQAGMTTVGIDGKMFKIGLSDPSADYIVDNLTNAPQLIAR